MADLELVGLHPDGDHLVLIDPDGTRHRVVIDEALRAAIRRDRSHLEKVRSESALRPRQIQAMIRAGASAETVAAEADLPVEQVRRYEGPVLAEREYVAQRARALHIGHSPDSPTLGDLVVDRLAARGVEADSLRWDAHRQNGEPWQLLVLFRAAQKDTEAVWEIDLASGTFTALDDESRWLSETDLGGNGGRHLNPVRGARPYDIEADVDISPALQAVDAVIRDSRPRIVPEASPRPEQPKPATEPDEADTEALLAELDGARGIRQPVEIDDEALAEHPSSAEEQLTLWEEAPGAHPAASRPQDATDATVLPGPGSPQEASRDAAEPDRKEPADQRRSARSTEKRSKRNRRTSVPTWDEIVFGARND